MEPNIYQCDYCKLVFKIKGGLVQHIATHHIGRQRIIEDNLICDYCKTVFKHKEELIDHIANKHINFNHKLKKDAKSSKNHRKRTEFPCDTCGLHFETVEILRMHIRTDHTFEDFRRYCKKSLQKEEKLVKKLFQCGLCETKFITYDEMERHARKYHDVTPKARCDVCCQTFYTNSSLADHKKVCSGSPDAHSCRYCPKLFTELVSLEFHVRIFHGATITGDTRVSSTKDTDSPPDAAAVYKCNHCSKAYYSDRSLKHHIRLKHTDEEVICNICSKVCSNKFYLKLHMKIAHTEKSNLICEICNKRYSSMRNLRRHKEYTHKKVSRYKCMDCISLFKEKRSLRKHIRRKHPNSSMYPSCNVCTKRFESAKACKVHLRIVHSITINSHPCHLCADSLTSYSSLKHHIQTKHFLDSQIFKCQKCSLTFFGDGFEKHTKSCRAKSSSKSPHLCVICVKYFSSRKSLFRHLKLFHKTFDHITLAHYGSKGQRIPDGCDNCKKLINSDFFKNTSKYNINNDDSHNIIVFTCGSCATRYSALEMSILKHRFEDGIKFNISEFCTAEISENYGMKYVEPESTTNDFEIKTEIRDNNLPSSSNIKIEKDDDNVDVKPKLELEEKPVILKTYVKSEPMSP